MQVPARAATQAEQAAAQREIVDLQQQSAALDALFETRKAQFAGVLASLELLQVGFQFFHCTVHAVLVGLQRSLLGSVPCSVL